MKLEDELQRMRDLAPETDITLDAVEQGRARRHRSRQVATIALAIVVALGGTSLLVGSFDQGNDGAITATEPAAGAYVFSDVTAGPSKAEPRDLAVSFTVDWSNDLYPGIHICRFIALAEDGSIVGEFTEYYEWEPGRYYRDVPGDPNAAVTGEIHCQTERLDTPGITDVTPIPHDADTPIDEIEMERQERLSAWALQFDVDGMSDTALAANVRAVWSAIGDEHGEDDTTRVMQLTDRFTYLCGRVPSDREMLRDFCG